MVIPERHEILLVIAFGKPAEQAVIEKIGLEGDINYWGDGKNIHRVPKPGLDEIILDL